ncbi:MAG: hypothetical protein ACRDK9_03755 [Solirubrobacterales bacterium]
MDAVVPIGLLAAMTQGARLECVDPIDARLRAHLGAIQRLERESGRAAAELATLRGSTSWRITAPIRRLRDAGRSLLQAVLGMSDRGSGGPVVRALGRFAWRVWHTWAQLRQRRRS